MTTLNAELDRKAYRMLVGVADRLARFGDAEAAKAEAPKVDTLVARWPEAQRAELLEPLLGDSEEANVRLRAATDLLGAGREDLAIPALESLRSADDQTRARAVALLKGIRPGDRSA